MRPVPLLISPRTASLVCVACAMLALWTGRRALRIDTHSGVELPRRPEALRTPMPGAGVPAARLAAAVGKDPFHVERRRPAVRFRLPGESQPSDSAPPAPSAAGSFLLIGTAVLPQGRGFAMCQWGADPPRLVRVGERVGDLTLKQVARGRATFVDGGGRRMEVRVPKAGT